ncbi:MAG: YgjV family protein [Clostridia bacterium]|nr:YgjV family protein [Clostridia bacterium]
MTLTDFIAQGFGIIGLIITVLSFQCKGNTKFFIMQALGGFMYFLNFALIGALAGALFNLTNMVRGALLSKDDKKVWKVVTICSLYTVCYVVSVILAKGDTFQIFLATLPFITLFIMSILMWKGNAKHIRYFQIIFMSPSWIVHNIFNFTLGGLICETMNMCSAIIFLIRNKLNQSK